MRLVVAALLLALCGSSASAQVKTFAIVCKDLAHATEALASLTRGPKFSSAHERHFYGTRFLRRAVAPCIQTFVPPTAWLRPVTEPIMLIGDTFCSELMIFQIKVPESSRTYYAIVEKILPYRKASLPAHPPDARFSFPSPAFGLKLLS